MTQVQLLNKSVSIKLDNHTILLHNCEFQSKAIQETTDRHRNGLSSPVPVHNALLASTYFFF